MKLNINTDYGAISPYSIMIALAFIVGLYVPCTKMIAIIPHSWTIM